MNLDLFFNAAYLDARYDRPGAQVKALWNARVGWSSADDLWDVVLTGRNLLEKEYITTATDFGGFDLATIVGRPGAPRTYAVQVTRSF